MSWCCAAGPNALSADFALLLPGGVAMSALDHGTHPARARAPAPARRGAAHGRSPAARGGSQAPHGRSPHAILGVAPIPLTCCSRPPLGCGAGRSAPTAVGVSRTCADATQKKAKTRRSGFTLTDWLVDEGRGLGCGQLHLDSGTGSERFDAHRLYHDHGLAICSHHFARGL